MGAFLDRILLKAVDIGLVICTITMAVIGIPVVLDVFGRFFFSKAILGVSDISEILMAVMAFSAFAYVQAKDQHISVDLLTARFSLKGQALIQTFIWALCLAVSLLLSWTIFQIAMDSMKSGAVSAVLSLPMWPVHMFCTLGTLLLSCAFLRSLLQACHKAIQEKAGLWLVMPFLLALAVLALPLYPNWFDLGLSKTGIGFLCFAVMFVLIFLGMPIGIAMALIGGLGLFMIMPKAAPALNLLGSAPYYSVASVLFMVVPMFLLMGEFALYTNLSKDMFTAVALWLGRTPGGLAAAAVGGCAGFAAICGDSMATAATMASAAVPEMRAKGYDPAYGCAAVAAGGTLGILIPPSTGFIIYSIITEQSVGDLFMAGVIPGILLMFIIMGVFIFQAARHPEFAPPSPAVPLAAKLRGTLGLVPMLVMILLVLGGILKGVFSPTEGGAMGAFFTLIYGLVRRAISGKEIVKSLVATSIINARLMVVLIGVGIFGYFLAITRLPNNLADLITGIGATPALVLTGIIILYIVLGCLMNVIPMMMLTLPAIFPTVLAMGFDPVWFGVLSVVLMELGQITPPVGIIVFTMSSIVSDVPVQAIFRKIIPVFLGVFLLIGLLIAFPQLALWLPAMLK